MYPDPVSFCQVSLATTARWDQLIGGLFMQRCFLITPFSVEQGSSDMKPSEQSGPFPSLVLAHLRCRPTKADGAFAPIKLMLVVAQCHPGWLWLSACRPTLSLVVAGFTVTDFCFVKKENIFSSNYLVLITLVSFLLLLHFVSKARSQRLCDFISIPHLPLALGTSQPCGARSGASGWSWKSDSD